MEKAISKFANSAFINSLRKFSEKLTQNPTISTISGGMAGTMCLIMIGAVIQIFCALGELIWGWKAGQPLYDAVYLPYKLTMGMLGFFMCFTLAYNYSKRLNSGSPMQNGFISIVCYLLVASPPFSIVSDGINLDVLNLGALGSSGLFVAMIVGLVSVRISKIVIDKKLVIKMPDTIPEGVVNSFNAIIPAGINIIIWHGLSLLVSHFSEGSMTLANLITRVLEIPIGYLVSPLGMILIVILRQLFWFFGIHGTGVIFSAIMAPYIAAYATNAQLAASGQPLVFNAVFLYGAIGCVGGPGNTLALVLMGLKSKSQQIKSISKASLVPAIFNLNEPVIFGYPVMYNPMMLIPFVICPVIVMGFLWLGYSFGLLAFPQILILSCLPMGLSQFMITLDWKNALFPFVMLPICWFIYYPFFKIYEKQCVNKEIGESQKHDNKIQK